MSGDWLSGSPIRSDPADFDGVADAYDQRWSEYFVAITEMRDLFDAYAASHKGPNIKTIVNEGYVIVDALASLVAGFIDLHLGFKSCADGLRSLESEIDNPGGLGQIR